MGVKGLMKKALKKCDIARKLRSGMTDAERRLWAKIRNKQLGYKFRRQQQIGEYIVDFVCLDRKLIVEIDGGQHAESKKDEVRDKWLAHEGYQVIRFWNNEVSANIRGVLERLKEKLSPPSISPPQGGRRRG